MIPSLPYRRVNVCLFSHRDYYEAIEWLRDRGLNADNSRFKRILDKIGDFGEGEYSPELIWGLSEVDDLYRIYLSLKKSDDSFVDVLRKAVAGSTYLKEEKTDGTESARNFVFELFVASFFNVEPIRIDFETIADFRFKLPCGTDVYVECKRVNSIKKVEKNLSLAYSQIEKRGGDEDVGIIAISITRLLWELMDGQLVCSHPKDIKQFLDDKVRSITSGIGKVYTQCKTIMVVPFYNVPFVSQVDNGVYFYRDCQIDLKYHDEHLDSSFSDIVRKRAAQTLLIAKWLTGK